MLKLNFPESGQVWRKDKFIRHVTDVRGNVIYYRRQFVGSAEAELKLRECWITTWREWARGAVPMHTTKVRPPQFAIMNTCDGPMRRNICQWVEGVGYCYMRRDAQPHLKDYDGMNPQAPTSIEDFGFDVEIMGDEVVFVCVRKSIAKYEDGKPRPWQDQSFGKQFTLPLVKGPIKRIRRTA